MKYLFIKADLSPEELKEIQKEIKKPHYHNHHHHHKHKNDTLIKSDKPTFKADKTKGEGKPSELEMKLRQNLLDQLKKSSIEIDKILEDKGTDKHEKIKKLKPITEDYARECKKIIEKSIIKIWEVGSETALQKLEENNINPDTTLITREETFEAFREWQLFKAEMNAEYLRLDMTNKIHGNNYFKVTYGE